ncbi:DUF5719 family protein [Gleimia sp. 6138-11-ORH1]|uniref:DUF5719 family protein n=1 Tax=Gleimia sp. 6138-11-ORH1 TaxID=2973937 RepID=UPI002168679C|nr:DUF5719 family protein [Gleimia sp. 6138-11-ORH1]MCS4484051.1 DUF5719 family protein [Gleimia sp. 6138-11-ORH1]
MSTEQTPSTEVDPKLAKLISTGKVLGTFTTLGVTSIALLGALTVTASADLWLRADSSYARTDKSTLEVVNQVSLPEHSYLLGCIPFFPDAKGAPTGTAVTNIYTAEGTAVTSVKPAVAGKAPLVKDAFSGEKDIPGVDPLVVGVSTQDVSSFTGSSFVVSASKTLKGITSSACQVAHNHHWFVAGSTEVGEATFLTILNPSANPTQVSLQAWSSTAKIAQTPTLTVAGNQMQTVNLATYFPTESRLGLHVTVNGPGAVVALHSSGDLGLATRGIETVRGVDTPAVENIFTGVEADAKNTRIRILNPGLDPATATIEIADPTGSKVLAGAENIEIAGAAVFELDLGGLGKGPKTIVLRSNQPLVANVFADYEGEDKEDAQVLADRGIWSKATKIQHLKSKVPPLQTGEKTRKLSIFNPATTAVKLEINGKESQIPAKSQLVFEVEGSTVEIKSPEPVYASLLIRRAEGKTNLVTHLDLEDPRVALPPFYIQLGN